MKTSRRDMLRGAALTGAFAGAGAIAGCAQEEKPAPSVDIETDPGAITARTLAEAEKLQGISFTPDERAMMIEDLEVRLETMAALRAMEMPNTLAPAQVFNPKLPRKKIPAQKNILALSPVDRAMPANEDDIAFASVVELGAWLRSGVITSVQLTELYLKRISEHDDKLHAFITVTPELAREQASKADNDLRDGRDRGPLHGIPYGLKDLADTKDILTTWGATPFKDRVPGEDADVARKLRLAGAVLLGKTSCGAIAYGDQWFDAKTRNPWNTAEGSSGSSAGSASSVAAGLCAFAIGSETYGSIMSPSERCGTAGLRPTFGRVSRAGVMALCWSLDKLGPICRSVEDTAAVLSQINGYDADDPGSARMGFTYVAEADVSDMIVGYVPQWLEEGDEVDRKAMVALRDLGVTLKEFPWPQTDFRTLVEIVLVEAAAAFSDLTLSNRDDELAWQEQAAWPNTWRAARFVSAVDYVQIDRLRRRLMEELGAAFDGFDALIGPNYASGAVLATNATGHPQLCVRAGYAQRAAYIRGAEGEAGRATFRAPRGVSLWSDLFEERKIIALGAALERALGASTGRPPGFG